MRPRSKYRQGLRPGFFDTRIPTPCLSPLSKEKDLIFDINPYWLHFVTFHSHLECSSLFFYILFYFILFFSYFDTILSVETISCCLNWWFLTLSLQILILTRETFFLSFFFFPLRPFSSVLFCLFVFIFDPFVFWLSRKKKSPSHQKPLSHRIGLTHRIV